MISEQDLLNIGLSKNYVKSLLSRIQEYNEKRPEDTSDQGVKVLWQTAIHPPIQEHEMTWGKEYEVIEKKHE